MGDIHLNTHKDAGWGNFRLLLYISVHENTHAHQYQLMKKLTSGKLKPSDPVWDQVALFAYNQNAYIDGCSDLMTYQRQPLERDAWTAQRDFQKAFEQGAKKRAEASPAP
jgi:hypothetical protein